MAHAICAITRRCGVQLIFKASFDKANRTSVRSFRGPGLADGLRVLQQVKDACAVPILTDIHEPHQAAPAAPRSRTSCKFPRICRGRPI